MLNSNLDLNITKYVCVDWKALVDAIDDIGGLDLEITNAEMKEINYLIPEVHKIDKPEGRRLSEILSGIF